MESIWFKPDLAEEIMRKDDNIFEQTHSIITDIVSGRLDITSLIENMAGVLTNKDAENRERGMKFFTNILKEIPKDYLSELQIKFISKFYIDRLKDNHRVIPPVIEGYLSIVDMKNYNVQYSGEYLTVLFREVPCQSQVRQDRYNIYLTIEKILDMDAQYMKTLGPDFVYGFISAMDGERDPRNLLYLFHFLPKFLAQVPLGHLVEEMFDVISCYYPIDFHPSPGDPAAVSRDELAAALRRCLCARAEFADQCLVLLIEKLDSSLAVAKRDSLKLLTESCKTFKPESYGPFLKTLWSSIQREIAHKTDDELKMAAHEALASLVATLAAATGDDRALEHFLQAILISMQTAVAEATTVARFTDATKTLLTVANASERSCETIAKAMIPAIAAYYEFRTSSKLQIASLEFAGDLYEVATHWRVAGRLQTDDIPRLCLSAVSSPAKEYQIAGFKTLIRVKSALKIDLVLPFVEILMHNIQYSTDEDLLSVSVDAVHAIARTYPELIMSLVVKGNCDLDSLIDRSNLEKRLNLLSNLASIDDFTQTIIEQMLKVIKSEKAPEVIKALNDSISNTSLYPDSKVEQIESDHGLIESVLAWLVKEIEQGRTSPDDGYDLISNTIASLPAEKQTDILTRHTSDILVKCKSDDSYFKVLECLYRSVHRSVYDPHFDSVVKLALNLALESESEVVRVKACCLVAHFLNKAESGQRFDAMYEILKNFLTSCSRDDVEICPRLICLYGWITNALILRGSDLFQFWLNKIVISISNPECSSAGSEAVRCIVSESPASLSPRQHCRLSLLHRQRMFQAFATIAEKVPPPSDKEPYLTTWAYVLEKTPKSVLNNEIGKIVSLAIDALEYDNKDLLIVMVDILTHFVQENNDYVAQSLQTILPRLISLTTYAKSMDVRIKSLQCLYEVANCCATRQLLAHKQDTLLALAPVLDDRKRLVRNAAVRARTRWFLVGAPGENKLN